MDMLMAALLLLAGPDDVVLTGQAHFSRDLEGGAWTMRVEGVSYDLHGVPAGVKDGDWVQVVGTIRRDRACVHMTGILLQVRSIRRVL